MTEDHDQTLDEPARDDQPGSRARLAWVLAALCVLTLIGGAVLWYWLYDRSDELSSVDDEDRAEVIQAAEVFTETWNTFRPDDAEDYVDRVSALLSTKFATEFEDAAQDVVAEIVRQRLFSKGEVLDDSEGIPLIGIASIDDDSAEVLVVSDATRVANRQRVLRHWRWQVSLVKVDGQWLVDSFDEV